MVEEAFALSPISARAALPSEADYDAIREAFMETARGRWFLSEYAKRNRHADTNSVLEAVSRIESNLSNRKDGVNLADTIAAIRSAIRNARVSAVEALPRLDSDITYAAARDGARMIGEITKSLREYGADERICDLLDAQVMAIQAGQKADSSEARKNVLTAFDTLTARIEQIITQDGSSTPSGQAPTTDDHNETSVTPLFKGDTGLASQMVAEKFRATAAATPAARAAPAQAPATPVRQEAQPQLSSEPRERPTVPRATPTQASAAAAKGIEDAIRASLQQSLDAVATPPAPINELASELAMDLAVLDLVAIEMSADQEEAAAAPPAPRVQAPVPAPAPAPASAPMATQTHPQAHLAPQTRTAMPAAAPLRQAPPTPKPTAVAPPQVQRSPAPAAVTRNPADRELAERVVGDRQRTSQSANQTAEQGTLGETLLANGMIPQVAAVEDALAVIRRMSQAERIAFFS